METWLYINCDWLRISCTSTLQTCALQSSGWNGHYTNQNPITYSEYDPVSEQVDLRWNWIEFSFWTRPVCIRNDRKTIYNSPHPCVAFCYCYRSLPHATAGQSQYNDTKSFFVWRSKCRINVAAIDAAALGLFVKCAHGMDGNFSSIFYFSWLRTAGVGWLCTSLSSLNLSQAFPNVETALRICLCMIVSNASDERSFSELEESKGICDLQWGSKG